MGFFSFIFRAIALSPMVFLRYSPALITFSLILVGIILSTNNPWVIGLVGFIMGTFGAAFLAVCGIRGGLGAVGATAAGTADGYMTVVPRFLFIHFLLQLLFTVALAGLGYFVLSASVLPNLGPGAFESFQTAISGLGSDKTSEVEEAVAQIAALQADPGPLRLSLMLLTGGLYTVFALCVAAFGIPMAAISANAVQYSPRNDLILGLGRFFPHQFTLYMLAMTLPAIVLSQVIPIDYLAQTASLTPGTPGPGIPTLVLGAYFLFAPCVSYAGMAIGYDEVKEKAAQERREQSRPNIDFAAERENLASLRKVRTEGRRGAKVYDPVAEARAKRLRGE